MAVIDEFRELVKSLHRAGIEVILDVVFNHTAEGDAEGPAFCFRGLADGDYHLQNGDGTYIDVTGCGNTCNTNHPVVRRLIHHSLRHWVQHRDQTGQPTPLSPILWDIDTDPVLAGDTYTLGPRSIVVLVVGLSPAAVAADGHPDRPVAGPS